MPREPYRQPLTIDGQKTEVIVTRFTREQSSGFRSELNNIARRRNRTNERLKAAADDAAFEAALAQKDKENEAGEQFQIDTIRRYVTFGPGHLAGGRGVETGAEIIAAYDGDIAIMTALFDAVVILNTYAEDLKNDWRSRHGFVPGSTAASRDLSGTKPASAARSASRKPSAESAGA